MPTGDHHKEDQDPMAVWGPPKEYNPIQKIAWYAGIVLGAVILLCLCAALVLGVVALGKLVLG